MPIWKLLSKVSSMENEHELERELRAAERAEAAPWTDYPPTPAWYPPLTGAWAALLVLAATTRDTHPVAAVVGLIALIAVEMAFINWYRRYRGVMPSFKTSAPRSSSRRSRSTSSPLLQYSARSGWPSSSVAPRRPWWRVSSASRP